MGFLDSMTDDIIWASTMRGQSIRRCRDAAEKLESWKRGIKSPKAL